MQHSVFAKHYAKELTEPGTDLFATDGHLPQAARGGREENRACLGIQPSARALSGDGRGLVRGIRRALPAGAVQGLDADVEGNQEFE